MEKENEKMKAILIPELKDVDVGSDVLTSEEALAKISMTMAEPKKIKLMTEVTDHEIRLISALSAVATLINNSYLKIYLKNLLELKVSQDRQGRKEIIELTKTQRMNEEGSRLKKLLTLGISK